MSFTSFGFVIFFPAVLLLYYVVPTKAKKYFLILCSALFYLFYGIKYLTILILVTLLSYLYAAIVSKHRNRVLLALFIVLSIAPLIILKYGNPFINFAAPVGISFYTLQAISYIVDAYRKDTDIVSLPDYIEYMLFFPTIVSGPIKKANEFIPQINTEHRFDYAKVRRGLYMMALGFIEKLFLADNCAKIVANVFDVSHIYQGSIIMLATVTFGIQLYFDFAGYSYIAIGASHVLGYDIPDNFRQPYFATSIKDFWRRWHISLSSFLRDYVYIPLGGSRCGFVRKNLNLMITFLVSGFWHGVGLNYIFWGALHGIYQILANIKNKLLFKLHLNFSNGNIVKHIFQSIIVFILVDYAWLFFRARSITQGFIFTRQIILDFDITAVFGEWIFDAGMNKIQICLWILVAITIFVFDLMTYRDFDMFDFPAKRKAPVRWLIYIIVIGIIVVGAISGMGRDIGDFIYNRF